MLGKPGSRASGDSLGASGDPDEGNGIPGNARSSPRPPGVLETAAKQLMVPGRGKCPQQSWRERRFRCWQRQGTCCLFAVQSAHCSSSEEAAVREGERAGGKRAWAPPPPRRRPEAEFPSHPTARAVCSEGTAATPQMTSLWNRKPRLSIPPPGLHAATTRDSVNGT